MTCKSPDAAKFGGRYPKNPLAACQMRRLGPGLLCHESEPPARQQQSTLQLQFLCDIIKIMSPRATPLRVHSSKTGLQG